MPRFAANLTMLFTEVPFLDRFALASQAGFEAVEFLFPYTFEKKTLVEALHSNGLKQVLHNLPAGNWDAGERGIACHPDRIHEFRSGLDTAIDYATALACPQLNCLAGKLPDGVTSAQAHETLVANLQFAAQKLKSANIKLLMEPINTFDIPGFFLNRMDQAKAIIDEVGSDNLFIQYDLYHAQRVEGELAANAKKYLTHIGHIQLADNPGRNEPGTGEMNYPFLFKYLDKIGYAGWIGCEYKPATTTQAGLGWIKAMGY